MTGGGQFDYIIIGAGSAGCVLADRLSADAGVRILVLEAGPDERVLHSRAHGAFVGPFGTERVWNYVSGPEPGAAGRRIHVPQGRMLGGGSSINGMIYIRGDAADYDGWAASGCRGWAFVDVLPYFRKSECNERLADEFHGVDGPLSVVDVPHRHPLNAAFVRAAQQIGLRYNADFNGESQLGVGFFQVTQRSGVRESAATAFLRPAMRRGQIALELGAEVESVLLSDGCAVGAKWRQGGAVRRAQATRGVLVCAGTLGSPKVLMLSGIGPGDALSQLGIEVRANLSGVGRNYQDHLQTLNYFRTRGPISLLGQDKGAKALRHGLEWQFFRRGLLTSNVGEACAFVDFDGDLRSDVQIHAFPVLVPDHEGPPPEGHGMTIAPCDLRPKSRGTVTLGGPDPRQIVRLVANALSHEDDVANHVRGLKLTRRIGRASALAPLLERELQIDLGEDASDRELEQYVRGHVKTVYHPVGTCRMGEDGGAVVNPRLAVRGVERLYVVDASVMPAIPSGNTNAPTLMIAEKAADMLRGHV